MFSVLVIRLRSLRLLRVSGIVMRLRMFLLLITFLKASHSFRNRLLVICKNAYLFATMIMTSVSLLVMRSNLWASGYDVDGTDQTSLGQFSGRVQQTYKHSVPRFFVPEHGTMFTLALVRFPPTATKEIQYLNAKGALTYTDIAGDPVLYGNLPPREISMKDVFRSGDSSKKFKIAEGQWYRYAPSYVSPAYHLLEGFPFIQEPPSGDLQERVLI